MHRKRRLCIFSFYDRDGYVDEYVSFVLNALTSLVSQWIIVINGSLDESGRDFFARITKRIYYRENVGYDAGAYRYVLCKCINEYELNTYDEIILCNNTFFLLRDSFKEIFDEAGKYQWDFWGITGYLNTIFSHIQSYFLVFSNNIIKENLLIKYFSQFIDETTQNIGVVCAQFEMGIFGFLSEENDKVGGCIIDLHDLDIYLDSYRCLQKYHLPILKKKTFSYGEGYYLNMYLTLDYVLKKTEIPLAMILDTIYRIYSIRPADICNNLVNDRVVPLKVGMSIPLCNDREIVDFLKLGDYYIYGAGIYACKAYWRFGRRIAGFLGFVISNNECRVYETVFGYPVFRLKDIRPLKKRILIAVKTNYADEIIEQFTSNEREKVLRIF